MIPTLATLKQISGVGPLSNILTSVDSKLTGLWLPTGIHKTDGTHWDDATTNAFSIALVNTPTNTTVSGQAALLFNGTNQSGATAATWNTIIGHTAFDFICILTQEGDGGTQVTGANALFNNKGPIGDESQFIDMIPYRTTAGNDFVQTEIWNTTGGGAIDLEVAAPARSAATLVHVYGPSSGNLKMRVNGGTVQSIAIASIHNSTGHMQIGKTGAAVPFFNCKISFIMACNAVMSGTETSKVEALIKGNYNQPTWAL